NRICGELVLILVEAIAAPRNTVSGSILLMRPAKLDIIIILILCVDYLRYSVAGRSSKYPERTRRTVDPDIEVQPHSVSVGVESIPTAVYRSDTDADP